MKNSGLFLIIRYISFVSLFQLFFLFFFLFCMLCVCSLISCSRYVCVRWYTVANTFQLVFLTHTSEEYAPLFRRYTNASLACVLLLIDRVPNERVVYMQQILSVHEKTGTQKINRWLTLLSTGSIWNETKTFWQCQHPFSSWLYFSCTLTLMINQAPFI